MNRAIQILAALALAFGIAAPAQGQGDPTSASTAEPSAAQAFRAEIARLYPSNADEIDARGGIEAIAATLDSFWSRVKADEDTYLPLLRAELVRPGNPAFFYFDGAELLRDASDRREDGELALSVIEQADLSMVDRGGYLIAVNWYVSHGYDTTRAALRFMDQPRDTIIVQPFPHVFEYSTLEAMIFSLFGMDEDRFLGALIDRVQTARDDQEIFVLLHCIWAAATPRGRQALAGYAEDESHPEAARRYAREMLVHELDGPRPTRTEAELRAARRAVIARPFVHNSFENFHALTDQLVRIAGRNG